MDENVIDEAAQSAGVTPEQAKQVLRTAEEARTQAALKKAKDTLAKSARPRRTGLFALPSVKNLRGRF